MTSGGARSRSGPPPDPQALRRDRDASEWQRLPAHRLGDPPPWPLPRPNARERTIWAEEWRRGQAVMWEALEWQAQVAMYVRQRVRAEDKKASEGSRITLLRMEDGLGLSYAGLQRNRWILAAEPRAAAPDEASPIAQPRIVSGPSAKDRLKKRGMGVVEGGK